MPTSPTGCALASIPNVSAHRQTAFEGNGATGWAKCGKRLKLQGNVSALSAHDCELIRTTLELAENKGPCADAFISREFSSLSGGRTQPPHAELCVQRKLIILLTLIHKLSLYSLLRAPLRRSLGECAAKMRSRVISNCKSQRKISEIILILFIKMLLLSPSMRSAGFQKRLDWSECFTDGSHSFLYLFAITSPSQSRA